MFYRLIVSCLLLCTVAAAEDRVKPEESPSVVISVCHGKYTVRTKELHVETSWQVDFVESIRGVRKEQMENLKRTLISCAFPYPKDYIKKGGRARPDVAHYNVINYSRSIVFGPERKKMLGGSFNSHDFSTRLIICFASPEYVSWAHEVFDMDGPGSGCHTGVRPRVYSIQKQGFVTEEEFIDMKKFPDVCNLMVAEYMKIGKGSIVWDEGTRARVSNVEGCFTVELDGMRWWLPPYTIFCGARGNVEAFLSWKQLRPYLLPGVEEKFRLSEQQKMDLCVRQE